MSLKIQIDSDEIWSSLEDEIHSAKEYVYIQTLSFEGDTVGKRLAKSLASSNARDIRVLVDATTKFEINDKYLFSPRNFFKADLQKEVRETRKMMREMVRDGVQVKFVNPVGLFYHKLLIRNHKKLVVIDDRIAYIGGINFSEHNFHWHDMMIRIENSRIAVFLKNDFLSTWKGKNQCISKDFKGIKFHIFNVYSKNCTHDAILELIKSAKRQIFVESPYLTFPYYDAFRELRNKGVRITVLAPEVNNWWVMRGYTSWESRRSGIDLRLYKNRMTHLKAMLIDDHILIVGSSNFDYLSYLSYQEVIAVIHDADVIEDFKKRVIEEDLKNSRKFDGEVNPLKGRISHLGIKSLKYISLMRKFF
jgi:cardiolipin synthase